MVVEDESDGYDSARVAVKRLWPSPHPPPKNSLQQAIGSQTQTQIQDVFSSSATCRGSKVRWATACRATRGRPRARGIGAPRPWERKHNNNSPAASQLQLNHTSGVVSSSSATCRAAWWAPGRGVDRWPPPRKAHQRCLEKRHPFDPQRNLSSSSSPERALHRHLSSSHGPRALPSPLAVASACPAVRAAGLRSTFIHPASAQQVRRMGRPARPSLNSAPLHSALTAGHARPPLPPCSSRPPCLASAWASTPP